MANPPPKPKPRSWLDSWAGGRLDTFRPSVDGAGQVPTFDPRLVSNDPKTREQAQREQREARARMARDVTQEAERRMPSLEAAGATADLAGRILNPVYDVARTLPEAREEWEQGGFWPRARAARNMSLAVLPFVFGGVKKVDDIADLGALRRSKMWTVTDDDGRVLKRFATEEQARRYATHGGRDWTPNIRPPDDIATEYYAAQRQRGAEAEAYRNSPEGRAAHEARRERLMAALNPEPSSDRVVGSVTPASAAAAGTRASRLWGLMTAPGATGFTVSPKGLRPLNRAGFGVADPAHTLVIRTGAGAPTPEAQIEEWLARPSVRARLRDKDAHLGGWWDKDTGRGEINVTDVLADRDEAVSLGQRRHQKALGSYDETGAYIEDVPLPAPRGNDLIISVAERYKQDRGLVDAMSEIDEVDPVAGRAMARQYERLKSAPDDPEVRAAYEQFAREVDDQFRAIEEAGVKIEYVDDDPYPNSAAMMRDLRENNRLKVLRTNDQSRHPILTNEQNDRFRAVHDFFGHASEGNQFGVGGEERAFRRHVPMFSPLARRVMATETRGQNSWYNFGPNADRPKGQRVFAEQKAALWPEEMLGEYDAVRSYDPDAARYDRFRRPESDVGDYTIPVPRAAAEPYPSFPTEPPPYRAMGEAQGGGAGGETFVDIEGVTGDVADRLLSTPNTIPGEKPWRLSGFSGLTPTGHSSFPSPARARETAIQHGYMPGVLGGSPLELEALERARALEGEAELARYERVMPLVPEAEARAKTITEQQAEQFETRRLYPAIRFPTGATFRGSSHFDAVRQGVESVADMRRRLAEEALGMTEEGFSSDRTGFLTRREGLLALPKAQQRVAGEIGRQLGYPDQLTSEGLGEVQVPPVPVRPLPRDDVRATIARMDALLGTPGEPFVPRPRGIFDRSVRDPVIAGHTMPPASGRTNPIIEEIAADPETYRLTRRAIERGLPMGGESFYELGPIRASYGEMGGPLSFDDFRWAGSASSAMSPVPMELSNASILMYAMRHGITPKQAIEEMLRRYPGAKSPYFLPVHTDLFERYRRSGRIDPRTPTSGSRKIPSYGRAKGGEADVNTIDTHEQNFLGMPSRWRPYLEGHDLTGADYEALDLNRRIARDLGIQTRQAQAGRWLGGAEATGVRTPPGDYVQLLEDAILRTASETGRGTDPRSLQSLWRKIAQGEDFILPFYGGWTRPK